MSAPLRPVLLTTQNLWAQYQRLWTHKGSNVTSTLSMIGQINGTCHLTVINFSYCDTAVTNNSKNQRHIQIAMVSRLRLPQQPRILMSSDGSYAEHIASVVVVQKATQMSGWVLRTFFTRVRQPMLILYKSLILSRLDYCSALWNPSDSAYFIDKSSALRKNWWYERPKLLGTIKFSEPV